VIDWLYQAKDEVPSPAAVAAWTYLGQLRPEKVPLWAAHWLVAGYDGEHVVYLAGLHGDDPREVREALPDALRDCGVEMPGSDADAATFVFTQLARMHLEGETGARRVVQVVESVLIWCRFSESVLDLPFTRLYGLVDEWDADWGRTAEQLAEVVREACEEQFRNGPAA
jgi:hypothetical protein